MGGAITADGERTDEEREGDPPHPPEVHSNFSAVFAPADSQSTEDTGPGRQEDRPRRHFRSPASTVPTRR